MLAQSLSFSSVQAALNEIKNTPAPPPWLTVDFDNVSAPCLFDDTIPLRGIEQGAYFSGLGSNGGAILNQCGNFGVEAHSPPNFLAFNNQTTYTDGGVPRTGELLVFEAPATTVSLWVSGGDTPGFFVGLIALGKSGVQGLVPFTTASTWQQVTITGESILAIEIVGNPQALVVDDISSQ